VLTRDEVRAVIHELHGVPGLMAVLPYGAGLRLLECARLRVKDVDFATNQIVVRRVRVTRIATSRLSSRQYASEYLAIITAYLPDPYEWTEGFRRRRFT
jgi:integrase